MCKTLGRCPEMNTHLPEQRTVALLVTDFCPIVYDKFGRTKEEFEGTAK